MLQHYVPQAQHALSEHRDADTACAVSGGVSAGLSGRLPFWIAVWDRVEPDYMSAPIRTFSRMACGSEFSKRASFLWGVLCPYEFLGSLAMWVSVRRKKASESPTQ